jgi:hypothetical protein
MLGIFYCLISNDHVNRNNHHPKKGFCIRAKAGKRAFSHAFLGRARHSNHVKTEGTKNTAKRPLPQWPSQRNVPRQPTVEWAKRAGKEAGVPSRIYLWVSTSSFNHFRKAVNEQEIQLISISPPASLFTTGANEQGNHRSFRCKNLGGQKITSATCRTSFNPQPTVKDLSDF